MEHMEHGPVAEIFGQLRAGLWAGWRGLI